MHIQRQVGEVREREYEHCESGMNGVSETRIIENGGQKSLAQIYSQRAHSHTKESTIRHPSVRPIPHTQDARTYTRTHTDTRTYVYRHTHTHTYKHTHTHTHAQEHAHCYYSPSSECLRRHDERII